jgi:hypothetical protein
VVFVAVESADSFTLPSRPGAGTLGRGGAVYSLGSPVHGADCLCMRRSGQIPSTRPTGPKHHRKCRPALDSPTFLACVHACVFVNVQTITGLRPCGISRKPDRLAGGIFLRGGEGRGSARRSAAPAAADAVGPALPVQCMAAGACGVGSGDGCGVECGLVFSVAHVASLFLIELDYTPVERSVRDRDRSPQCLPHVSIAAMHPQVLRQAAGLREGLSTHLALARPLATIVHSHVRSYIAVHARFAAESKR